MAAGRKLSIAVIAVSQVAAMTLWFSATAIIPALQAEHGLDSTTASLFTSAVQLGFVVGTLASALLSLADRWDPRRLFMWSALAAAAANGAILLFDPGSAPVILLRFATGVCMAGIYPVGMKLASTWAEGDMGTLLGLLVGALTLGSAAPHLFNALGGIDWRLTLATGSVSALAAALTIRLSGIGPNVGKTPPFNPRFALAAWTTRSLRLANLGYLGHMWELYAMWAWIGVATLVSYQTTMPEADAISLSKLTAFLAIGLGGLTCFLGGWFADRIGKAQVTIVAMAISGLAALGTAASFGGPPWITFVIVIVWGMAIIPDSPQFSGLVADASPPEIAGSLMTFQTAIGFALTIFTVQITPVFVAATSWPTAIAVMAFGPAFGVFFMRKLR